MKWDGLPIVIFGTSGYSREVLCIIEDINRQGYINQFNFIGYVSDDNKDIGKKIGRYTVVCSDDNFYDFAVNYDILGCVLSFSSHKIKSRVFESLSRLKNIVYPNIISPFAHISDIESISLGRGNIIAAGCTLTCDIELGNFNIININSTIGHDSKIGNNCTINPLVSISGGVTLEDNILIGTGVSIKQGIVVGNNSTVGMGAFIVKDVKEKCCMVCEPAKSLGER